MTQTVNTAKPAPKRLTKFRQWVTEIWRDNCDERLVHHEQLYNIKEYWDKYKWWLRREYRYKNGNNLQ